MSSELRDLVSIIFFIQIIFAMFYMKYCSYVCIIHILLLHYFQMVQMIFLFHFIYLGALILVTILIIFTEEDKYVVFVSGLCIGSSSFNPLQFQLLVDHITGHLGDENVCSICALVFVEINI